MYAKRVILQGALLSSAGMLLSMLCQLGGAMIFTRVLRGGVEVGVFALLILASDFLTTVNNGGLWSSLPKLVAASPTERRPSLIGSVLAFQFLVSAVLAVLVYIPWLLIREPRLISTDENWIGLYPYLWLLPLIVFFGNMRENVMAIQAGLNRYALRTAGLIAGSVANLLLVVVAVWYMNTGLPGLMLASLAGYLAAALFSYALLTVGRRPQFDWPAYRDAIVFSAPLYANNLLNFAFTRLDTLFVGVFLGPAAVAYYELGAKRLAGYGSRILQAALVPYLPSVSHMIARNDRPQAARLLDRTSNTAVFVCYLGIMAALIVQERLITLLFPVEYLNALPALAPVLVATCLGLQGGIMGLSLIALGRPHLVTMINIATALIAAGADFILIPQLGLAGAGWAVVAAMVFTNVAQTWAVHRNGLPIDLRRHLRAHLFMIVSMGIMAWGGTVPWRAVGMLMFAILSVVGGAMPWREIQALLPAKVQGVRG